MIHIRMAESSDLAAVLDTLSDCLKWLRDQGIKQWDRRYPTPRRFTQDIERGTLAILDVHGFVAATVALDSSPEPEYSMLPWKHDAARAAIVHRLMVRPQFQHQGWGQRMMEYAEQRAVWLGYASIRLDAYAGNLKALRLYERLGYSYVGTIHLRKGAFKCYEKRLVIVGEAQPNT